MTRGQLFILSAPSGAGKSSLAQALVAANDNIAVSVSHTTRLPRPGEEHGVHYFFVSPTTFQSMIKAGDFLEYAQVFNQYYGTSRRAVDQQLAQGKHVVLDIDWQGMREVKARWADAITIFILPPSRQALEDRLRHRAQDSNAEIGRRMRQATSEMRHYNEFDFVIVNDDFSSALADIANIVRGGTGAVRPLGLDPESLLVE